MAVKSPLNLERVSSSVFLTRKELSSANQSVKNISNILINRTKVKRESFATKNILRYRRVESERRADQESQLEASNLSVRPGGPFRMIQSVGGSFLQRILGFVGYLGAGWILSNLPTWIQLGREFISRLTKTGQIISGFLSNTTKLFTGFGTILDAVLKNVTSLDFTDSSNRLETAFGDLALTLGDMGAQIEEGFKLITEPYVAPPLGTPSQDEGAYPETRVPGESGQLNPIHKQALDIISGPESGGSYNAMNQGTVGPNDRIVGSTGNSKTKVGKELTSMTLGEIMQRQAYLMDRRNPQISNYGIYAAGRYQIIPITFPSAMKGAGLKPTDMFSPTNQDKMGLAVLKSQGIGAWTSGGSRYSAKETAIIKQAQRTPMGELRAPTAKTSPTPAPQSKLDLSKLGFRLGERAGYSRSRGRIHAGRDIPIAHGTSLYAITDAVITDVGYDGGYGYYITFVDTNGIEHFYGHLREIPRFKRGQTVSAGTVLGYVGSTGRSTGSHLHWEVSPRIGEVGYPRKNVIDPIEYGFDPKAPFGAKISATQRRVASQNLRRERKGPQIYLINDNKPAAPATSSGGYYSNINSDINEFNMLNKFIQKKLLTDLSYL
jgi:murein DD-endopeptidase MepM/ murein hydrolase activator NlpD